MKEKRIRDWNQSAVIERDPFLKSLTPNYNADHIVALWMKINRRLNILTAQVNEQDVNLTWI